MLLLPMFLRSTPRKKDGKIHRYFSVVENRRLPGAKTVQRTVLYLGEINDQQQAAWRKTLEVFDEEEQRYTTMSLFPEDREIPEHRGRRRYGQGASGPGNKGRRQEEYRRAVDRSQGAVRKSEDEEDIRRGASGRDVHYKQPGRDRGDLLYTGNKLSRGRDTGRVPLFYGSRLYRRTIPAAAHAPSLALLRPPSHRRGGRCEVPQVGCRGARRTV